MRIVSAWSFVVVVGSLFSAFGCGGREVVQPPTSSPAVKPQPTPLVISVSVSSDANTFTIRLRNRSDQPVGYYDDLSSAQNRRQTFGIGPAEIRLRDPAGKVLTENEYDLDGWWNHAIYSSSVTPLPATLTPLPAGEERAFTYPLPPLLYGCPQAREWKAGNQFQVRATVRYDDPTLRTMAVGETAWEAIPVTR